MIIDSHAHYDDQAFDEDREEVLMSLQKHRVGMVINVGASLESTKRTAALTQRYSFVYGAAGVHPDEVGELNEESFAWLREQCLQKKIVAVGEIGLDYYWNKENKDKQKELFIKQIDIANKYNKPIIIHTREAVMDTISILKEHPVKNTGIFHCCPLNQELIKEGLKLGYYISFTGVITFKNAKPEEAVKMVPLDRILIETDSPYMSPEPLRGTRNNSINVKLVAQKMADIKGIPIEDVAKATYNNANNVFRIKNKRT